MDAIRSVVEHLVDAKRDAIPDEVVAVTKRCLLDTAAAMLAGTGSIEAGIVVGVVREWAGRREAAVANHALRVPAHHAALANATMARAWDIDDVLERASLHVHASVVPAALAIAERVGGVTGDEFLTAVILGSDLVARLGLSNKIPTAVSGMNSTYQYGTFGATAACGRLLRLDHEQLLNALGIAYSLVAGNSQCLVEGAMTARVGQGTAAHAGVVSAVLASRGLTAARDAFEGRFGYFNCYQRGEYRRDALTDSLGVRFEGTDVTQKRYSCCMHAHAAIDAVLELMKRHDITAQDIASVHVGVNRQAVNLVGEPAAEKRCPTTPAAAQFSLPFSVATAIVKQRVFIDAFSDPGIRDPKVLSVAERVTVSVDPEIEREAPGRCSPATVTVFTRGAGQLQARVDAVKGHPSDPLSFDGVADKLRACNEFAKEPLPRQRVDEFIDRIDRLEALGDVARLAGLLAPVRKR